MRIKKGFTLRTVMGQHIILAEGTNADSYGKIIALNESAAMLWEALKGRNFTAADAAAKLVATYGIGREQALADATRLLALLQAKGLAEESGEC